MPNLRCILGLSAGLLVVLHSAAAQQNDAAERLIAARAHYYTPTATGLKSFGCKVAFDWKDYLTRFGGQPVSDDNPMLLYLNATKLSVTDALKGMGMLVWINTENPPEGKEAAIGQIRDGMVKMFDGYFQSWNPYMNGGMVPIPDSTTAITPMKDGIQLRTLDKKMDVMEVFDKNVLLSEVHLKTAELKVDAYPTYQESPDGLIIKSVRSLYSQPPTAPATEVSIATTYKGVSSYQLPSAIDYEVKNVGSFHFSLMECEVETSSSSPIKH